MEPPRQSDDTDQNDDDCFLDAHDDLPFHDCADGFRSDDPTSEVTDSALFSCHLSPKISQWPSSLRRRSVPRGGASAALSDDSRSDMTRVRDPKTRGTEKRFKIYRDSKENGTNLQTTESSRSSRDRVDSAEVITADDKEEEKEGSAITIANAEGVSDAVAEPGESSSSNLLIFMAGLVVKAVGFQLNLVFNFVKFPIGVSCCSYTFFTDPIGAIRHARVCFMRKFGSLSNLVGGSLSSLMNARLNEDQTMWKVLMRFGWGLFWSIYGCTILCGLLVFSVVFSGWLIKYLVEEPLQIKEDLNFDYTKSSPVAYVPVKSCDGIGCGVNCKEEIGNVKSSRQRFMSTNHKLQASVLLTLPESEYNKNLGMFQVRAELLSADGKVLSSKTYPCMLKFKSEPIRMLLTFLKIAPLVAGYISESQTLELKMRGFTERDVPTSCVRVIIEQRAEFRAGAGVPEIYEASLALESELPFFKRILWCWKKSLFIWTSMMTFMMELLFILICCWPIIFPKARPSDGSAVNNSNSNNVSEQS